MTSLTVLASSYPSRPAQVSHRSGVIAVRHQINVNVSEKRCLGVGLEPKPFYDSMINPRPSQRALGAYMCAAKWMHPFKLMTLGFLSSHCRPLQTSRHESFDLSEVPALGGDEQCLRSACLPSPTTKGARGD